jgi:hypothetical protein
MCDIILRSSSTLSTTTTTTTATTTSTSHPSPPSPSSSPSSTPISSPISPPNTTPLSPTTNNDNNNDNNNNNSPLLRHNEILQDYEHDNVKYLKLECYARMAPDGIFKQEGSIDKLQYGKDQVR